MYQLLLYVHIVAAVLWVGGSFYVQALAIVVNSDDPSELPRLGRRFELIGNWVFVPAAALLLVSGLAMTAQMWSFGQAWIVASLILWMFSAVAGAAYLAPRAKRASALFEAEGPGSVEARRLTNRMFLVSRLELVSFAVVIALMVFKPTL
jgi:uncharacterized membrane protein